MQTLFDAPDFTIMHDAGNQWLYAMWRGVHAGVSGQGRALQLAEQVRRTGSNRILNDSSQDLDGWGAIVNWLARDYFQLLAHEGIVAVAWVLPRNLRAYAETTQVLAKLARLAAPLPVVNTFADLESACSWLQKMGAEQSKFSTGHNLPNAAPR